MAANVDSDGRNSALPEMLTMPEAARLLRIGRTLAYQLAARFLADQADGIPVVRIGGCLRVPRHALLELVHHGRRTTPAQLDAAVNRAIDALVGEPAEPAAFGRTGRRPTRPDTDTGVQLSFLDPS